MEILLAAIFIGLVIGYLLIPFILLSRISSLQEEIKSLRSQLIFQLDSLSKAARTSHREPASTPPTSAAFSKDEPAVDSSSNVAAADHRQTPPAPKATPAAARKQVIPKKSSATTGSGSQIVPSSVPPVIHHKLPPASPAGADLTPASHSGDAKSDHAKRSADRKSPGSKAPIPASQPPGKLEAAAKDVLRRIWNWIIIGEENVPHGGSMEYAMASQWLLRIGVLILVFGIGFFLKYSIDRDLIPPPARVAMALSTGLALLTAGVRMLFGPYRLLGHGLMGTGITTLYFSVYAATSFYQLISLQAATVGMIIVTSLSGGIAVRFRTILVAVVGIWGGYLTPVMLGGESAQYLTLFGYLTILAFGVMGMCIRQDWQLLNYLSFLFHWGLVWLSLRDFQPSDFSVVMPFLVVFFAQFSSMTFLSNLVRHRHSHLLDILILFANSLIFFLLSSQIVSQCFDSRWVSAVTIAATVYYIAHARYFLATRRVDREILISFVALAALFLGVTIPILLSAAWITAAWSLQALTLLWLSGNLRSPVVRQIALGIYALAAIRLTFLDLPRQYLYTEQGLDTAGWLWIMLQRVVALMTPVGSLLAAPFLMGKSAELASTEEASVNSSRFGIDHVIDLRNLLQGFLTLGIVGMLAVLHLELNATVGFFFPELRLTSLTILWLSGSLLIVRTLIRKPTGMLTNVLSAAVTLILLKIVFFDLQSWNVMAILRYADQWTVGGAFIRLIDLGLVTAFLLVCGKRLRTTPAREQGRHLTAVGLLFLLLISTLETRTFLHEFIPRLEVGGVSILWTLFALAFLLQGLRQSEKALRVCGLILFSIVTIKAFLFDLQELDQIFRVVAFIALGILVLSGSFLYLRARDHFQTNSDSLDDSDNRPTQA